MQRNLKGKGAGDGSSAEVVSKVHQDKINKFAIRNAWTDEIIEDIAELRNDLKNIEDAKNDLFLLDDDDVVPVCIGETFVEFKPAAAIERLEADEKNKLKKIKTLEAKRDKIKDEMEKLKAELYVQFGDSINLEK